MCTLSKKFMEDLNDAGGILFTILTRVKNDHTLMLAIRENSINIYYRGGSIVKIDEQKPGHYLAHFDNKYNLSGKPIPHSPLTITSREDTQKWVDSLAFRKNIMDEYFVVHNKAEREFQQLIVRENNGSTISNESEYFITDIEFDERKLNARFDLLAIRWLSADRKVGTKCRVALMEMKYGDGALGGEAGITKHLRDIEAMILDRSRYESLLLTMVSQFHQLDQLGLLKYNKGTSNAGVSLDVNDKPEVIFILANHNPRSTKLRTLLDNAEITRYAQSPLFDLRFFVSSFAGYGLHANCMRTLDEFKYLLCD
jgi:hypothetical protein